MSQADLLKIRSFARDVPDFPKPGILFRDITPLLADADALQLSIQLMAEKVRKHDAEEILAIESRGFVFGAALSQLLRIPFYIVRKPGKLPRATVSEQYSLEYGYDALELNTDAVKAQTRYAIVDDVIATGGTTDAACRLARKCDGVVACCEFLIELGNCNGGALLDEYPVESVLHYD